MVVENIVWKKLSDKDNVFNNGGRHCLTKMFSTVNGRRKHCLTVDGLVDWLASTFRKTLFRENFSQIDENQTHHLGQTLQNIR